MTRILTYRLGLLASAVLLAAAGTKAVPPASGSSPPRAPSPPASGIDRGLVVDRNAYFRVWTEYGLMRLNGDVLRSEGEKLFGRSLPRIERYVKRLLKGRDVDWAQTDWRDVACYLMIVAQAGDNADAMGTLPSVAPPAEWASPDFDDSSFDRQRLGAAPIAGDYGGGRASFAMHRRALYMRTYFEVDDPSKAADLTLSLTYRGGARVLVNGKEIARGSLPAGDLGAESFGADYPLEAYCALDGEFPPQSLKRDLGDLVGELRCGFDEASIARRNGQDKSDDYHMAFGWAAINRKGWDRITGLRDRKLGPMSIPPALLRKGANVLAIELRSSRFHPLVVPGARPDRSGRALNWLGSEGSLVEWDHVGLVNLELRSPSGAVGNCRHGPDGLRLWVDDPHNRLFDKDFSPAGWPGGAARFVGGRNGVYSAQLGLTSSTELHELKATVSDLVGEDAARIPASAVKVQYLVGHDIEKMAELGFNRCAPGELRGICRRAIEPLYRYCRPDDLATLLKATDLAHISLKDSQRLKFFDHISDSPPARIAAGACQPIWLSLRVPENAPAGRYKGTVTVHADGATATTTATVEAEVFAWRVPDPEDFLFVVQSEQSPYALARHYNAELWSDRHFQLIESSFRQLGRIGNSWVFVPVVQNTEIGNGEDTMVRWVRRKDGQLAFDYSVMDRYLAIARKQQGRPRAVCFLVMQAVPAPAPVLVRDETTGKTEPVDLGPGQEKLRRSLWRSFASSLVAHMKSLGLEEAMYWGQPFDDVPDKGIVAILAEAAPGVGWTSAGHFRAPDATFRYAVHAYGTDVTPDSFRGWTNPYIDLLMTRMGGSIICVEGISTPFTWRVMCDRAIHTGFRGVGRVGADYFDRTWFDGVKGGYWNMVGRAIVQSLWPGESGADSSARNEMMLEGIQEAEARIYLEQALDREVLPAALASEVKAVLDGHFRGTLHIQTGWADPATMDVTNGWQGRSRRLYRTAAAVAAQVGIDVDRTSFGQSSITLARTDGINGSLGGALPQNFSLTGGRLTVPAMGKRRLTIKLRNWSDSPRQWTAASADAWIVPEKPRGAVIGQQELGILLDGKGLTPGQTVSGAVTISDVDSGAAYPVRIDAEVGKGMELDVRRTVEFWTGGGSGAEMPKLVQYVLEPVLNVPAGGTQELEYPLTNSTAERQSWKIESDDPEIATEPSYGQIAPGQSLPVKIVARSKNQQPSYREATLTLTAADGAISDTYRIKKYVIPAYRAPTEPTGRAVYLNDLDQARSVKGHVFSGFSKDSPQKQGPYWVANGMPLYQRFFFYGLYNEAGENTPREQYATSPFTIAGKTFSRGLWVSPWHETVYDVEGAGFSSFVAHVGMYDKLTKVSAANTGAIVNFEVYVDGKLRAQSGLMKFGDAARLLVVNDLEKAKRVKLVTRRDDLVNDWYTLATWADPKFIMAGK